MVKTRAAYAVGSIVVIAKLINKELSNNRWCLSVVESNPRDSLDQALQHIYQTEIVHLHISTHFSDEVLGKVTKIIGSGHIGMSE